MRWLYVRLGISSSSSAHPAERLAAGHAGKGLLGSQHIVHHDSAPTAHDLADLDTVLDGQLELTDIYGISNGSDVDAAVGRVRDGAVRSKRSHAV
jgi:hypothetical protein